MYENGYGVTQDYNEAVKWYIMSAEKGNASAQNKLGNMYLHGNGVTKNSNIAVRWYRKSAEQGNGYAMKTLKELDKHL
jgi:TPR repeat protein